MSQTILFLAVFYSSSCDFIRCSQTRRGTLSLHWVSDLLPHSGKSFPPPLRIKLDAWTTSAASFRHGRISSSPPKSIWTAESYLSCFTLSCRPAHCMLMVTFWWSHQHHVILKGNSWRAAIPQHKTLAMIINRTNRRPWWLVVFVLVPCTIYIIPAVSLQNPPAVKTHVGSWMSLSQSVGPNTVSPKPTKGPLLHPYDSATQFHHFIWLNWLTNLLV